MNLGTQNAYSNGINTVCVLQAPQKELVDPYVVVEFAGKSLEGKFIEGSFDPIWNELMILQGDFPSIAENLILKVYDK